MVVGESRDVQGPSVDDGDTDGDTGDGACDSYEVEMDAVLDLNFISVTQNSLNFFCAQEKLKLNTVSN